MAVFTAIGASIFGAGTFLAAATAAGLQVAAGIALNLIGQSLSGSNKSEQPKFGVQGTLQSGGDVGREFPFGWAATAGSLVYANFWGLANKTPNAFLTQVIAVSDMPIDSLSQVWVNGELVTLSGSAHASYGYPVLEYRSGGVDHLWVKFYDGTQTTADTFLTGSVSSSDRPYTSSRKGIGVAYVITTALVNEELFGAKFPTFKFALNGLKLYDISKDTSRGGSGAHRVDDPGTWGGDADHFPAAQIHALILGITHNDEWLYGLQGTSIARMPDDWWIAQIEKCRATIAGPDGDEATYRCGGFVRVGAQINETVQAILSASHGRLAEIGGSYKVHVGAPGSSEATFSDEDIITTVEQRFTPFLQLSDTLTGISASHPNPSEGWVSKVAPPLYRTDLDILAGNRRLMADVDLDFVPYPAQVQRLMKSSLEEAQRARRHTFVLPPEFWVLEPGSVVTWTSEKNGYTSKLFRVDGVNDLPNLDVMIDITEIDAADYTWDQGTDYTTPVSGPAIMSRPAAQVITGWQAVAITLNDADGVGRRPSIEVQFDDDLDDIRDVHIQVRLKASGALMYDARVPYLKGNGSVALSGQFLPATEYEVRGKLNPIGARETYWSSQDSEGVEGSWLTVTTDNVRLQESDLSDDLNLIRNQAMLRINDLEEYLTSLGNTVSSLDAFQQSNLVAKLNSVAALVRTEARVRATEDEAFAASLTAVVAQYNSVSASALFSMEAVAAAVGWDAKIAMMVRADSGDSFVQSGIYLEAKSNGTARITLDADLVVFTGSATSVDGSTMAINFNNGSISLTIPD